MQSIADIVKRIPATMKVVPGTQKPDTQYTLPDKAIHLFTQDELRQAVEHCPNCQGIGYTRQDVPITDRNFGTVQRCPQCLRFTAEKQNRELVEKMRPLLDKYSMLKDELLACTFTNYEQARAQTVYDQVRAWAVRAHKGSSETPWLYLFGPTGNGKTHLAAAAANGLTVSHVPVVFTTFTELCGMVGADNFKDKENVIRALQRIPVLIIDDILDYELGTDWKLTLLFRVLDSRYVARKPTMIVSNLPIVSHDSACIQDFDPRIASRLADKSLCREVVNLSEDYRIL